MEIWQGRERAEVRKCDENIRKRESRGGEESVGRGKWKRKVEERPQREQNRMKIDIGNNEGEQKGKINKRQL